MILADANGLRAGMSASLDPHLTAGWLGLVLGAALLPPGPARRICGTGLGALALGLAALRSSAGSAPAPPDFAAVNTGLVLLGIGCAVLGAWWGARTGRGGYPAAAAITAGSLILVPRVLQLTAPAPPALTLAALAILLAAGALVVYGAAALRRRWVRAPDDRAVGLPVHWLALLLVGALATGFGPHLAVVFLGAIAAGVAGWRLGPDAGARTLPMVPILVLLALAPAYRLFAVIAGAEGLTIRRLPDLPLSPAAESLLAPLVLLAGWGLTGLWPLPRRAPAGLTAPVGLLLVARVALAGLPSGVEHWRPAVFPVLLLGMWQAAASGRWPSLAGGAALLGLGSGTMEGLSGAWWLGSAALVLQISAWLARRNTRASSVAAGAGILLAGWGALPVLAAGLRVEVVYTAFAALGVASALAPARSRQPVEPR